MSKTTVRPITEAAISLAKQNGIAQEELISEIVKRVDDAVKPLQIILFGSAARGEMTPDSDLDLLIIMSNGTHRRRTAQAAYRALRGIGIAKDIVVVTETDVEKYGSEPSLVLKPALEEGREIYHAAK